MTKRSYTDGNEVSSRPAIRSVWDVVKREVTTLAGEVTTLAGYVAATGLFAAASASLAICGRLSDAALYGVSAVLFGLASRSRAAQVVDILKKTPVPNP